MRRNSLPRRQLAAASMGGALDIFDFMTFAFLAPIIARNFFPTHSELSGLLLTFSVFAVGYLVRPVGGVIFGRSADRQGRRRALTLTIVAMGIPTGLIGVLPTYAHIGIAAPIALTALRLAQGLAVGGDLPSAAVFAFEHAPAGRRGVAVALVFAGVNMGLLAASLTVSLSSSLLSPHDMDHWGWRLPFLASFAIAAAGLWMRRRLAETPTFLAQDHNKPVRACSIRPAALISATVVCWLFAIAVILGFTFMPTYLSKTAHLSLASAAGVNSAAIALLIVLLPVVGTISDRLGVNRAALYAAIGIAVSSYPLYWMVQSGGARLVVAEMAIVVSVAAFVGSAPAMVIGWFAPHMRTRSFAASYNVAFALFGGTAPLVATLLMHANPHLNPGVYLAGAGVLGALAISVRRLLFDTGPNGVPGSEPDPEPIGTQMMTVTQDQHA